MMSNIDQMREPISTIFFQHSWWLTLAIHPAGCETEPEQSAKTLALPFKMRSQAFALITGCPRQWESTYNWISENSRNYTHPLVQWILPTNHGWQRISRKDIQRPLRWLGDPVYLTRLTPLIVGDDIRHLHLSVTIMRSHCHQRLG